MTLIEALMATLLLAFSGSAALLCLSSTADLTSRVLQESRTQDCAEDAAERWFAGEAIPPEYDIAGTLCHVEVVADVQTQSVVIRAFCGQAETTITLPQS